MKKRKGKEKKPRKKAVDLSSINIKDYELTGFSHDIFYDLIGKYPRRIKDVIFLKLVVANYLPKQKQIYGEESMKFY